MSSLLDTWSLICLWGGGGGGGNLCEQSHEQVAHGCSGKRSRHTGESATVPAVSMEDKIIIVSLSTLAELD